MATTYHCDECGNEAPDGACPDHPKARVSLIVSYEPVTDTQIEALSVEAGSAGDQEMVVLCERALEGDTQARSECQRAIDWARAQQ